MGDLVTLSAKERHAAKWRFYRQLLSYPFKWLGWHLRRDAYLLATLRSVDVEALHAMRWLDPQVAAAIRPAQRQLSYPRLANLRQIPLKNAADFARYCRQARMLVVDITPSKFSGATMDSRIALMIGLATAKKLPIYFIRAENIAPFQDRQRTCLTIPHQSLLVQNPDLVDFSNLAELIAEC